VVGTETTLSAEVEDPTDAVVLLDKVELASDETTFDVVLELVADPATDVLLAVPASGETTSSELEVCTDTVVLLIIGELVSDEATSGVVVELVADSAAEVVLVVSAVDETTSSELEVCTGAVAEVVAVYNPGRAAPVTAESDRPVVSWFLR